MQQEIPSSKKFALNRGESLSTVLWADFESMVLAEICALDRQGDIIILYNIVYYSVIILHCTFEGRYCFQRENQLSDL